MEHAGRRRLGARAGEGGTLERCGHGPPPSPGAVPTDRERLEHLERQIATAAQAWRELAVELHANEHARRKFLYDVLTAILHTTVVLALIAGAVVLEITGNDATLAWAALGGYIGGTAVERTGHRVANGH